MNHYVYQITYNTDKKYIGCRSCKCLPEDDTKYVGSSKHTPNTEIKIKEILKVFSTREEAIAYEIYLHNLYNVHLSNDYYNQAKQTSVSFNTQGLKAVQCEWIANKAKQRVHSHLQFVKKVYLKHELWIEYMSEYKGCNEPIEFKCPICSDITKVNKASNHLTKQVLCKKCAKTLADLKQKTLVGDNRTDKQKMSDTKRAIYKGDKQTEAQLEGRKKAAKTATGKKCKSRGKPGVSSILFKPWYHITPDGVRTEHNDITITEFIETSNIVGITRSKVFYATYKYTDKPVKRGDLKGHIFGFL